MWGLARLVRRPLGGRGAGALAVLARQPLTRGASVAVVRVGERALVLGVTDQNVTLLAEADPAAIEAAAHPAHEVREPLPLDALNGSGRSPVRCCPRRPGGRRRRRRPQGSSGHDRRRDPWCAWAGWRCLGDLLVVRVGGRTRSRRRHRRRPRHRPRRTAPTGASTSTSAAASRASRS